MDNGKVDNTTEELTEDMPGHTLLEHTTPEHIMPEHTPLEQTLLEQTPPEHTTPEHTPLEHTPPEDTPLEHTTEDQDKVEEQANLEVAQLQGLVGELREGLRSALAELGDLRQRDHGLEERLQSHQSDVDDKIMGLKNSLNTFKEELSSALSHVKDVSCRQRDMQKKIDLLHTDHGKDTPPVQHSKKSSKGEVATGTGEGHPFLSSQSELNVIQHYFASLPTTGSPHRNTASTQTAHSEQDAPTVQQQRECLFKSSVWRERKNSREETETGSPVPENSKRQTAALELLESERVYVSYLSLLLKANISFNGSEALMSKDKRPFPSSLRFLIQQHLELLHTLQERVLKCQWQGIMGDVFMRLTSKESDFLDFYVSYLKELPECLMAVSTLKPAALLESEIMGDESRPSLHTLLLQPVQRIPEYLLLLQGLLRQTDAEHPDYYLLLVCIQQFRSFTVQYHHLLQHSQELLLLHTRKEMKRSSMKQLYKTVECEIQSSEMSPPYASSSTILEHTNQVKRSKQRLLDQIQSRRYPTEWDRDRDPEPLRYEPDRPLAHPFFIPDPDPRNHKAAGLRSIPESEASDGSVSCKRRASVPRPSELHQGSPGSALVEALGEYLLPADPPGLDGLYEEDGDSLHNASLFDQCSSGSSDSSIDIAFVRCPKSSTSHHGAAANVSSTREAFGGGGSQGNGYKPLPHRACVSPDDAVMMRHHHQQHRPLQAGQRKSKSLNGLQLDSTVSGLDGGHFTDHILRVGLGNHAKLERQGSMGSKGSKGCPTPIRRGPCNLGPGHADKQSEEMRSQFIKDSLWGEEPKWRPEENHHTPLSERSRKEKGGFRNSFKKLFKKKSAEDKKEKTESLNNSEHETVSRLAHLEIDRGTAV